MTDFPKEANVIKTAASDVQSGAFEQVGKDVPDFVLVTGMLTLIIRRSEQR